jgi:hypothetical protein
MRFTDPTGEFIPQAAAAAAACAVNPVCAGGVIFVGAAWYWYNNYYCPEDWSFDFRLPPWLSNEANGDDPSGKPDGGDTVGDNPQPGSGNRINTDKPGGRAAAEEDFIEYGDGGITELPDGSYVAGNGVRIRTGTDGRPRVDIPAGVGPASSHETIHYN